jgi:signal transduction histidine kinase
VVIGLRARVALAFGLLSFTVAALVTASAYAVARSYLVSQREATSVTRALLDARAVTADLSAGIEPGDALAAVPSIGESQALGRIGETWYGGGVTVSPADIPTSLLDEATTSGAAQQRFRVSDAPYFGVSVNTPQGMYVELFPLASLDRSIRIGGWFFAGVTLVALVVGVLVGRWAATRLMRPVRSLAAGASAIADGDLKHRIAPSGDPDLDPIADAFNGMADAVEDRIHRERRFVANVSHELRSPVTAIVGTAELLDHHRDGFPARDADLVEALLARSRRLSKTVVDLLELGSETRADPLQTDSIDLAAMIERLLAERDRQGCLIGDHPIIRTDPRRVERVLTNLIDNAQTHGEGLTAVTVERLPGEVLVHVDDAGPGVDVGESNRLFEPFVRGTAQQAGHTGGAGLGLAIARDCAGVFGGEIAVGASPDGGARFTVRIPVEST